jgi:hypothetical protein
LASSIEHLADLDIDGLFPGHGVPVGHGGHRHILAARDLLRSGYG